MTPSVTVRRAYADDVWWTGDLWAGGGRRLGADIARPGARCVVAQVPGHPAPVAVGVVLTVDVVATVLGVHVSPGHRSRGIGGRVLDELLVEAARAGARRATAELPRGDAGAAAYVASRGFVVRRRWLRGPVATLQSLPPAPDGVVVRTTRDSLGMGDDAVAPHRREVRLPVGATSADLVQRLGPPAGLDSGSTWVARLLDGDGDGTDPDDRGRSGRAVAVLPPAGAPVVLDDRPLPRSCRVHLEHLPGRDPAEVVAALADPRASVRRR